MLPARLGGVDGLEIYFDQRNFNSNQQLEEILHAVRRSAVFLAITSRAYVTREWTCRELREFVGVAAGTSRLFAVDLLPLDHRQAYPPPLDSQHRLRLWRADEPRSQTPMPLTLLHGEPYLQAVHDLAEQIAAQLHALNATATTRAASGRVAEAVAADAAGERQSGVLLAQTTEDLDEEREVVRRYLEQFGYRVLPKFEYPQGGQAFREAMQDDLARSGLFVQLLGPRVGRRPADLPEGYARAQHKAATAMGVEVLQWRRPDLDPAGVTDPEHHALLTGESVIASGLESFKDEVRRRLEQQAAAAARKPPGPSLVFVNAIESDLEFANLVREEFSRRRLTTAIPFLDSQGNVDQEMLSSDLVDCDALVMIYGRAPPAWLRSQLKLFNKLQFKRSTKPRLLALYLGPPPGKPEDVGITLPDLRRIDSRNGWAVEPLRSLIEELRA